MTDVVVVGGANLDVKASLPPGALSATSNPGTVAFTAGGVGRNIAHNLARLGVITSLITVFGNDAAADALAAETRAAEVDLTFALRSALPSGSYVALLDDRGELVTAVNDMRLMDTLTPDRLAPAQALLDEAKLIVADCNCPAATLIYLARHHGGKLLVEPVSVAKAARLVAALAAHPIRLATPNRAQLAALAHNDDLARACAQLHGRGLAELVVHCGADGAVVSSAAGRISLPPLAASGVVDVTGAGDAAVAGLVYGLIRGLSNVDAARLGQSAAGLVLASPRSTLPELNPARLHELAEINP